MKTGVIKRTSLPTSARFDASYHLSEGETVKRTINNSPYKLISVGDAAERIFYGARARRVYVSKKDHGVPFLSSSDILLSDLSNVKYVSKKHTPSIDDMKLQKGWVLISRSGTVGNCAYTNEKYAQRLASEHIIRLVPNNILRGGFVYAYLASKYGYSLLTQGTFGAVIQHIEPNNVAGIPIPVFPDDFQTKVDDLIQESSRLREEAADLLEKAKTYFEEKYLINDVFTQIFRQNIQNLNFSFASYNNNIEVDKFISSYKDNSASISNFTTKIYAPPLFKHIYLQYDNGYPFMTGNELSRFNLRYYRWLSPKGVKNIEDYVVKKGTLLLYKSGTTDGGILGNTFIVDEQLEGCCLSDHVIRITFKDYKIGFWTFAFLKSNGGIKLLQRLATGTMIPFITPERIANLPIPLPDNNFESIVEDINKYIQFQSESKRKENAAISLVEKAIESWKK